MPPPFPTLPGSCPERDFPNKNNPTPFSVFALALSRRSGLKANFPPTERTTIQNAPQAIVTQQAISIGQ
jgi:hypothetical protein